MSESRAKYVAVNTVHIPSVSHIAKNIITTPTHSDAFTPRVKVSEWVGTSYI
jgi:hypothetical protein